MVKAAVKAVDLTRVDTALAVARALLSVAAALLLAEAPGLMEGWAGLSTVVVAIYPLPAAALLVLLWRCPTPHGHRGRWLLHASDVAWAAAATTVGSGAVGLAALLFVVFAAGQTWGLPEALATAFVGLALAAPALGHLGSTLVGLDSWALVTAWALALAGVVGVVGWLSSEQRRARAKGARFTRAFTRTQAGQGLEGALGAALQEIRNALQAREVALVAQDVETGRDLLWSIPEGDDRSPRARATALLASDRDDWLLPIFADAWHAERQSAGRWRVEALDVDGAVLPGPRPVAEEHLDRVAASRSARALTGVALRAGGDWEGRLLLIDAKLASPLADDLRFAQRLVRELGAVVYSRFLIARIRGRVGAMERARIARELHDGTIQSLVSIEMQIDMLRRQAEHAASPLADELARIQKLLRDEVLDVRDTMKRLRPPDVDPAQLVGYLDEMVARFQQDTGIHALFDCGVEDVDLSPEVCREIARIVREALHNVRRHSGAGNVLVRLLREEPGWRLVMDDDGRGFPFSGRLSHTRLDAERKGPYVIKERVRSLGGELSIETAPGKGARLEVFLPH